MYSCLLLDYTCLSPRGVVSCSRESTAGSLKDERDKVACHEGGWVRAGTEARDLLAVEDDYASETEVERAGEESGRDRYRDEIATGAVKTFLSCLAGS